MVVGGAGLIGSHTVDQLLNQDVEKVLIYDNFTRGREENLVGALKDPRCSVYDIGGDILQTDILNAAMKDNEIDGVFHLAALWLLQCHEYPRSAFNTNVIGTFNVIEACVANKIKRKHAFKSHILTKKGTKQKRNLTKTALVHESDVKSVKAQLCI